MSVRGLGLDLVDVAAFAAQLADRASGFAAATFTVAEREAARRGPGPDAVHLAGRFAAKEAFVKAWSSARTGRPPALPGVHLREIEVVDDGYGRPGLRLHGTVAAAVLELGAPRLHLSISHDGAAAGAVVVLEVDDPLPASA